MNISKKILIGFGSLILLLFVLVGLNKLFSRAVKQDMEWVDKSEDVLQHSYNLQRLLSNLQSGMRSYLLTGDEEFVKNHYIAATTFERQYYTQLPLISEDTAKKFYYQEIGRIVEDWRKSYATPLIVAKRDALNSTEKLIQYNDLFRNIVQSKAERIKLDSARTYFSLLDDNIYKRREKNRRDLALSLFRIDTIFLILAGFILLVGLTVALFLTRHISSRINSMINVAEQISNGNYNITIFDEEEDEMSRLGAALNRMTTALQENFTNIENANKELKEKNQELEQFAYVASHDLKEPVRMVSNYTQLLADRYSAQLDESAQEYVGFAVEGAHRIRNLINDLLEYVKLTQAELHVKQVNTQNLVERVIQSLQKEVAKSNAIVKFAYLPELQADENHLEHLFENLIDNALKFRGDKAPVIIIKAEKQQNKWLFSVEDNGIGIEEQYQNKVFTIFQRLHGRTEYGGNGIGLTICKKIVALHGGEMWFTSETGKGTIFFFTLPTN